MSNYSVGWLNQMEAERLSKLREMAGGNADFLTWLKLLDRGLLAMQSKGVLEVKEFDFLAAYKQDPHRLSHAIMQVIQFRRSEGGY